MLKVGDEAPDFTLPANGDRTVSLKDLRGKKVVLYFYPKDDTPGCTLEAKNFRDCFERFDHSNAVVIGVSKDDVCSHDKFAKKYRLPFYLVSDESTDMIKAYGVWRERSMYGRKYMGIERMTFLIDEEGIITHIWEKVKVFEHANDVLSKL